jgi:hypothetical protein
MSKWLECKYCGKDVEVADNVPRTVCQKCGEQRMMKRDFVDAIASLEADLAKYDKALEENPGNIFVHIMVLDKPDTCQKKLEAFKVIIE